MKRPRRIIESILSTAETNPDKPAIIDREGRTSYKRLAESITFAASRLHQYGVQKGDRVMIAAIPSVRFIAAYFASHCIGAIAVPIDKNAVKSVVEWQRDLLETNWLFLEVSLAGEMQSYTLHDLYTGDAPEEYSSGETRDDETADIIFTSATTGKPKGVALTYNNILVNTFNAIDSLRVTSERIELIPIPLHHICAQRNIRAILYAGGAVVLENGFGSIKNIYTAIKQNKCTSLLCTPSAVQIFYEQTRNKIGKLLGSLQTVILDTSPIPLAMKRNLVNDLPQSDVYNVYGVTEASGIVVINYSKEKDKLESIGKAVAESSVKIFDDKNNEMNSSADNCGRLAVRSGVVMRGYWRNEERTRDAIVNNWLVTNDLAWIDKDGYIFLLGRADDIIITGGEKASPLEIEDMVIGFNGIKECCCIGASDPRGIMGQVPVAFITLDGKSEYSEKLLFEHLKSNLDAYKLPYKIVVIDEIPKNAMGKFLRAESLRRFGIKRRIRHVMLSRISY